MGRLRVLSGREVCRILRQHGFVEQRRRGSHVVMQRRGDTGSITVPVPDYRETPDRHASVDHQAERDTAGTFRGVIERARFIGRSCLGGWGEGRRGGTQWDATDRVLQHFAGSRRANSQEIGCRAHRIPYPPPPSTLATQTRRSASCGAGWRRRAGSGADGQSRPFASSVGATLGARMARAARRPRRGRVRTPGLAPRRGRPPRPGPCESS